MEKTDVGAVLTTAAFYGVGENWTKGRPPLHLHYKIKGEIISTFHGQEGHWWGAERRAAGVWGVSWTTHRTTTDWEFISAGKGSTVFIGAALRLKYIKGNLL